jgi:CAAX prenyl protease-like protein
VPLSVVVGLVIIVQWVLVDQWVPYPHLGTRMGYDPFAAIDAPWLRWAFLVARLCGLVLIVPLLEELFWRSFLLRYATTADFTSLPVGQFSTTAFLIVVALSALAHPEWLVAAVASALFAWLLHRTRSLFAAIVSHVVANAALGAYILATERWHLW